MRSLSLWNSRRPTELSSPFDEFFREFDRAFVPTAASRAMLADFSPAVDVEEKDDTYHISVDLPGLKKDEIKIDLHDSVLTLSGERTREVKGEGRYAERSYGKFQRTFTLPHQVDAEKIEAKFEDGVLYIALPKAETAKARSIKIQ